MDKIKFPRTAHLPWSVGIGGDDIIAAQSNVDNLLRNTVVVTEKLDGENTSVGRSFVHARSIDGRKSESLGFARTISARFQLQIPADMVLVFENLYAVHSILYDYEPTLVLIAAYRQAKDGLLSVLSWLETVEWADNIGQRVAPVLLAGLATPSTVQACYTGKSKLGGEQEGYVVRNTDAFPLDAYGENVFKWVRAGHVAPNATHWMNRTIIKQGKR